MKVEKDFEEFVELLNKHEVEYVIVGAYAMALYAEPRNTGDIDFFYNKEKTNCEKLLHVLNEFGMESLNIGIDDLKQNDIVIQLGVAPVRIDLISSLSGITFEEAFSTKIQNKFGVTMANFISKEMLIKNKSASGRKKDLSDLEMLGE